LFQRFDKQSDKLIHLLAIAIESAKDLLLVKEIIILQSFNVISSKLLIIIDIIIINIRKVMTFYQDLFAIRSKAARSKSESLETPFELAISR
jgi:hypothetical protein